MWNELVKKCGIGLRIIFVCQLSSRFLISIYYYSPKNRPIDTYRQAGLCVLHKRVVLVITKTKVYYYYSVPRRVVSHGRPS